MDSNTISDAVTLPGGAEGALLASRYRIVRQLGQGGMGSVWLAEDTQLDNKQFAIKMLPSILVSNKRAYRQLKDEALVAMKLVHPNIVTLRAFEENGGNPFLVMDYIDGETLDDHLAEKGKLTEDETIRILKPIAAALDYAHGEGVVHRDVKPANVMIRKDGHPFILDFGISREMQETMTRVTGKLSSGTLLYMSPEQLRGQPPKPAQDVYSFAAMAYECISGHPPFYRGAVEDQIKNEQPEPLESYIIISGLVAQGLSKNPEARPPTCAAVVTGNAFRRDAEPRRKEGGQQSSGTDGSPVRGGTWKVVAALVVTALAAVGGWLWRQDVQKESTRRLERDGAIVYHKTEEVRKTDDESQHKTTEETQYSVQREEVTRVVDKKSETGQKLTDELKPIADKKDDADREKRDHATAKAMEQADKDARERERRAKWRKEGEQFTIDEPYGLNMTMNWCPPGTFTMGSPISEEGRSDNERQHEVSLTKGFWMGETEVTQGQWKILMDGETIVDLMRKGLRDDTVYTFGNKRLTLREYWGNWSAKYGDIKDDMPVYYVSWNDAVEFCRRLTQLERRVGHIPDGYA